MIYDHNITLIVPLAQLEIAKTINRHLDNDEPGGYEAFQTQYEKEGKIYAGYSRMCDAEYASKAALLVTIAEELFALCEADTRFETKPTLEECQAFCDVAEAYVDSTTEGYSLIIKESLL